MRRMGVGLQLYTLRSELEKDFEGTLRKVAALGYEGVEFAGYGGMKPEELKALLDELGLQPISSHVAMRALEQDLESEVKFLAAIGAKYAAMPWLPEDRRGAEHWPDVLEKLELYGKRFYEEGLTLTYHNHEFEFDIKLGELTAFETIYNQVPEQYLKVEMDIGWVQYAGYEPTSMIQKYAGRLPLLHLKDFRKDEAGIDTVELGRGELPLIPVLEAASEAGVEWIIVEQDHCSNPPLEAVAESMEWMKKHYFAPNQF